MGILLGLATFRFQNRLPALRALFYLWLMIVTVQCVWLCFANQWTLPYVMGFTLCTAICASFYPTLRSFSIYSIYALFLTLGFRVFIPCETRILLFALTSAITLISLIGLALRNVIIAQDRLEEHRQLAFTASKMASLGEMAGGVAHEINNPLAIIMGYASIIRKNLMKNENGATDVLFRSAQGIEDTVLRIATIVKGLSAFARNEDKAPPQTHSLRNIVDSTLSLCSSRLQGNRVELRVTPPAESLKLDCRATEISQVLINLLNNSLDATAVLNEKWIELTIREVQDTIEIGIVDSGKGIPAHYRDKIMEPFFTTKEIGKGTGLGLSISTGIVSSHGGKLYLDPACKNTRFVVELPKQALRA
jgi:signal transduction histidine kinase